VFEVKWIDLNKWSKHKISPAYFVLFLFKIPFIFSPPSNLFYLSCNFF
jgi:hypothetical protein